MGKTSIATTHNNKRAADEELTSSDNAKKSNNKDVEIEIDAQLLEKQRSSAAVDTASAAVAAIKKEKIEKVSTKDKSEKGSEEKETEAEAETETRGDEQQEEDKEQSQDDGEELDLPIQQGTQRPSKEEDEEETEESKKQSPQQAAAKASNEHFQRYQQEVLNQAPPQPTQLSPSSNSESGKPQHGTEEWHRQRRENHKEVERKRREAINVGIRELAQLIPTTDTNKAQILQRSVEYIKRLKENENNNIEKWTLEKLLTEQAVSELSASNEKLKHELELAYREIEQLKRSNKK